MLESDAFFGKFQEAVRLLLGFTLSSVGV